MTILSTKRSTSFFYEHERLVSFKNWPFDEKLACNPQKMAEAGWYACGGTNEPDLAQCFVCGKQLDGWEGDDDPWKEHRKHKADCPFVKVGKKEEDLTLFELIKMNLLVEEAKLTRTHQVQVEMLRAMFKVKKNLIKKRGLPLKENIKNEKISLN